jgi:hypothetical protein
MNAITVSHHFAEWNCARAEYSDPETPHERILEIEALDDLPQYRVVCAMITTPAADAVEVCAKFDVLASVLSDSTWIDARDRLLLESLRHDVLRLLG